jgi:hypothetical protein
MNHGSDILHLNNRGFLMPVAVYVSRLSLVVLCLAAQVYVLFKFRVEIGIPQALALHCALQLAAVVAAPRGFRFYAGGVAAWLSLILAMVVALAWITLVVPFAAIMGATQGDTSMLFGLLGLTAYLVIPLTIFLGGAFGNDM